MFIYNHSKKNRKKEICSYMGDVRVFLKDQLYVKPFNDRSPHRYRVWVIAKGKMG